MKIAIFTRGFSRDNDYRWKADWLTSYEDSIPDSDVRKTLESCGLKDLLNIDNPGILLRKDRLNWHLLVCGIPTNYNASRPGPISASFAFFDLDNVVARNLAIHLLHNWNETTEKFVSFIKRHSPPPCSAEWSVNGEGLKAYIGSLEELSQDEATPSFAGRFPRTYDRKNTSFKEYSDLVSTQPFSDSDGFKLVIGAPFSEKAKTELIKSGSDLLALPDIEVNFIKKNSIPLKTRTPSPKAKSGRHSEGSGPPKSSLNYQSLESKNPSLESNSTALQDQSWKSSSTGSRTRSSRSWMPVEIIAVVALVVIVSLVSSKKKDIDRPPLAPPAKSSNSVPLIEPAVTATPIPSIVPTQSSNSVPSI